MITYGFYNSKNGDRAYNATQFSQLFDGIITDGVFPSIGTGFVIRPGTGLGVIVGIGRAWFDHTWINSDTEFQLTISNPDPLLDRIDVPVIEINKTTRINSIKVVASAPAAYGSVVLPALLDTEMLVQYPLANVYVAHGATSFIVANITPLVGTSVCPYAASLVAEITDPGPIGNVLTSDGMGWISAPPSEHISLDHVRAVLQ